MHANQTPAVAATAIAPQVTAQVAAPGAPTRLGVVYSVLSYATFLASFTYFIFFLNNALVPKGVDDGTPRGLATAAGINLGLILLWGVQHSVMARQGFKDWWTRFTPAHTERATYVLASSVALTAVMWGWSPIASTVWHVESNVARLAIWGVAALGWALLFAASFEIDHFELFGVKQPLQALRGQVTREPDFQTRYIYRIVRHPIQTGIFFGMWLTPDMSTGHLLFAVLMSVYIFIGLYFEERALVRRFGDRYRRYRREVAMLVPFSRYL